MPAEPAPEPAPAAGSDADRASAPEGGAAADDTAAAPPDGIAAAAEDTSQAGAVSEADGTGLADTQESPHTENTENAGSPEATTDTSGSPGDRTRRGARGWTVAGTAVAVAAAITAGVLATGGGHHATHPAAAAASDGLRHTAVDVSPSTCGRGWGATQKPHAGTQAFDLHNSAASATEVYLKDPSTGRLFAEIEGLAPGTTRSMVVDLGSGRYAFECQQEDTDSVTGPTVTVPGKAPQGPSSLPVTVHDLIPPTLDYQKWINARMAELSTDTGVLKSDIDRGDLTAARRDWLTGHLVYERMGAAYDTFGDADGVINGTTAIGRDPLKDPDFTGFHRIEYGLWHGESAKSLRGQAATLDKAVKALRSQWTTQQMDPANMGLRAHEIIENAEQFELTGRTDYGSGTNLATASANIDGTREILAKLRPLLAARDSGLARLDASLDRAQAYLKSLDHKGTWTALDRLTRAQREQVNADFGDLLEQLAPVAAIFDVRRTV
ncbi:EfeM/EfeO family lipoprotein [Streptomyces sp. NBC_00669]|uniref:EfeM/EfeO family lipoprotein n=1 Tax=Streptomyces sp. NBC_00669 TaxID=2976011 RepID=UPI002E34B9AC|nr:EfeM/EfeO family lipoprotein [Streptomyces sp. NBC_00669]